MATALVSARHVFNVTSAYMLGSPSNDDTLEFLELVKQLKEIAALRIALNTELKEEGLPVDFPTITITAEDAAILSQVGAL